MLKWFSDYRINIQGQRERAEKGITAQRQTKEAFLPPADAFYARLHGCRFKKVHILEDFEAATVDLSQSCCEL